MAGGAAWIWRLEKLAMRSSVGRMTTAAGSGAEAGSGFEEAICADAADCVEGGNGAAVDVEAEVCWTGACFCGW